MKAPSLLLCAAVTALTLAPARSGAYVRTRVSKTDPNSPALWWGPRTVEWRANERGGRLAGRDAALEAVRESFAAWNLSDCSYMTLEEGPTTRRVDIGFDERVPSSNLNLIVFRDDLCSDVVPAGDPCLAADSCPNDYNCWDDGDPSLESVVGLTTPTFLVETGEIVDADMELNGAKFQLTAVDAPRCGTEGAPAPPACLAFDIANVATHEVGHFIGLDHAPDPEATMYAATALWETRKCSLAQDDIDGYCAIYDPANYNPNHYRPPGEDTGCGCAATSVALSAWTLAALIPLAARRRLRP